MTMTTWQESLKHLDAGGRFSIVCPDGISRTVWGYNGNTGDLFVAGWSKDVWMDCSDGTLRAEFDR